jgi:hypothetical protein
MTNIVARTGEHSSSLKIKRPRFSDLWAHYPLNLPAGDTYKLVGGAAYELYKSNPEGYANACALRLSRALNYGGMPIGGLGYRVKGGDGKEYHLRVKDTIAFLKKNLGTPDISIKPNGQNRQKDFANKKGIIVFIVSGWRDASGHATLWNGSICGDKCYFNDSVIMIGQAFLENVRILEILFWELK